MDNVGTVAGGAFSDCKNLATLYVGEGVKLIKANAFKECALTNVDFADRDGWAAYNGAEKYKDITPTELVRDAGTCLRDTDEGYANYDWVNN